MIRSHPTTSRLRSRLALAVGTTVFLTLVGAAGASALWTAPATSVGKVSATAGTVAITQSGFESLAVDYTNKALATAAPVTITNTGSVAAPYSLTLGSTGSTGLANGAVVRTWTVMSASDCTARSFVPKTATTSSWATIPVLTGTLTPGVSAIYCVSTSISGAQQGSLAAQSLTGTLSLSSSVGDHWSASTSATAVQKVIDTEAPSKPGKPAGSATTSSQTTLAWAASTDNVAVVLYEIYRNDVLVGTSATPSFADTGLAQLTAYSYTVKAKDAAGNVSAASPPTKVTTIKLWSKIVSTVGGLCLDGNEELTKPGTDLILYGCHGGTNQTWNFDDEHRIRALYTPLYLRASDAVDGAKITLDSVGATQNTWTLVAAETAGEFQIKNMSTGMCMDAGSNPAALTRVAQRPCAATSLAQRFTMTEMG